jgi:HK97 family phage portal protein
LLYEYGTGQNKVLLDPDDITHIPFMSLPASRRALNPVEYVGIAGALSLAAYEFGSSWFSQGASPDFILTTDAKLGQEEVNRIAQKFLIEHGGLQQSHLPLVLDRGLKAEKVMASPDEAQYLQTLEFARSVIGSWFGIPQDLIANGLQAQRPSAPGALEDEQRAFLTNCLASYILPLEEALSSLLPKGVNAAWDESKLSKPNATAQAERITALRQGQIATPNELRVRELGWAPIANGDDLITPLASNTSPVQTDAQDAAKSPVPKPVKGATGSSG